jgi:hypothetical protein
MSSHPEDGNLTRISFEVATERAEQVGSYLGHLGVQNLQMEPVEIAPGLRIDRDSEYLSEILLKKMDCVSWLSRSLAVGPPAIKLIMP